ncbi:MAG: hypothetical protein DRJ31_05485 [Candidatus Methanomethylicota archaeon]|uniref:HEPN domain-containing protein n=1 Tax=Thermoproteota archaeon TaxID=2056631 RepID=A0A497EQ28_9CREN|nr:MAG: hypothetical protein DRJ31_05485 [Candidatus Verstraetearchaeota archaeon]
MWWLKLPLAELEEVLRRKSLADKYYENYLEHYHRGEYSKASEYLWGVVNALTYALGLFYGKTLGDHSKVVEFLNMLASEHKDIAEGLKPAQRVHANFYHDFMDKDLFDDDRLKVEKMINKLATLLTQKLEEIASTA